MISSKEATTIHLTDAEDDALKIEICQLIIDLRITSNKEFIKRYPMLHELQYKLKQRGIVYD